MPTGAFLEAAILKVLLVLLCPASNKRRILSGGRSGHGCRDMA